MVLKCNSFMFHRSAQPLMGVGMFMTTVTHTLVVLLVRATAPPSDVDAEGCAQFRLPLWALLGRSFPKHANDAHICRPAEALKE